ncbi:unnamed protein product [Blepharisma stoltei]|uniref:P-type Ca(2+) transporter n=1 Tax=Blepharisma stoltei TaxID=1481888 RepID=A0AAU9JCS2_9CILI|nr:unnamed protein product [Blepharisma stoltei]
MTESVDKQELGKIQTPWHTISDVELIKSLNTNTESGLSEDSIDQLRQRYGWNELKKAETKSLLAMVFEQFTDLMVIILLVAAVISTIIAFLDGESGIVGYIEPIVILLILIANAVVGVWQESNAEAALEALKDLMPEHAKVLRSGTWSTVLAREVIPGDIVEMTVGSKVPADVRVLKLLTPSFRVNQSHLTGETKDIAKHPGPLDHGDVVLQDKTNIAFSSSTIAAGSALGVVVEIGMTTEIGKMQKEVTEANEERTPLQEKLDEFGNLLAKVIFGICALVWIMNFRNFFDEAHGTPIRGAIYYFKIAIALAVAAVPEGLPAVITTCLALGTRRMAQRNAIVRRLPSVETLGCTSVICSDKTGTLTTNEMTVTDFFIPDRLNEGYKAFSVSGNGFKVDGKAEGLSPDYFNDSFRQFLLSASLCNDSKIESDGVQYKIIGMATEAAIRIAVEKIGKTDNSFKKAGYYSEHVIGNEFKKLVTLEFTRERKSMSSLCNQKNTGRNILYVKGAPESIIERCSRIHLSNGVAQMTQSMKQDALERVVGMSKQALRCIAFAYTDDCRELTDYNGENHPAHHLLEDYENFLGFEQNLIFLGVMGMKDPPRPEVKESIALCKQAGIKVFMITGDNKLTAEAVADNIGITTGNTVSLTGIDLNKMPESELSKALQDADACIFSRTEPRHKKKLVQLLKSSREVVAMTGDGVNDAPALQEANIGVAMGIAGTEVAKRASDMILADDKFSTIVAAVEEGRSIYNNTKAFIRYLISSNIGEVVSIFLTAMLGLPEGFTSVQLLWVNLVTDGPPATALGFNPPDLDIMKKPPRRHDEPLISNWVYIRYFVIGTYVGAATVGIFVYWYLYFDGGDSHPLVAYSQISNWSECPGWKDFSLPDWNGLDLSHHPCLYFTEGKTKASTLSLTVLVVIEMLNSLNALSEDTSLIHMPPWVNPWLLLAISGSIVLHCLILYVPFLNEVFGIVPLTSQEWILVMIFSTPVVLIDECLKFFGRVRSRRSQVIHKKDK